MTTIPKAVDTSGIVLDDAGRYEIAPILLEGVTGGAKPTIRSSTCEPTIKATDCKPIRGVTCRPPGKTD